MSQNATYTSTTTAFRLTATPAAGTALSLTDPSSLGNRPLAAFLQATVANIRYTTDGSAPTASHGQVLTVGNDPFLYAGSLIDLQFIRESAGAILNVVYGTPQDTIGPQGPQGAQGTTGSAGPQGPTGPAGADGGPIQSATVTLNTAALAAALVNGTNLEIIEDAASGKFWRVISVTAITSNGDDVSSPSATDLGWEKDGSVIGMLVEATSKVFNGAPSDVTLYPNSVDGWTPSLSDPSTVDGASVVLNLGSGITGFGGAILTSEIAGGGAGTGYTVLDEVTFDANNSTARIDTVGGSGQVLTYTILNAGTDCLPGQNAAAIGGSGADFFVHVLTVNFGASPPSLTVTSLYSEVELP